MRYTKVRFKRSEFDKLSTDEQCLFVLCCHLFHRTQVLARAIVATRVRTDNAEEQSAVICQASLLLKIHCGFLFEGWCSLEKIYFTTQLYKKWSSLLPLEGQKAEQILRDYFFRKRTPIGEIRHHYGFHTDLATIKRGIKLFNTTDDIDVLVPVTAGPILCPVAEYMANATIFESLGIKQHEEFENWIKTELATKVTGALDTFCHTMAATIAQHGGATRDDADIDIPFTTKEELNLSYFVEPGVN